MRQFALCVLCPFLLALTACKREAKELRPAPAGVIVFGAAARESDLHPGGAKAATPVANPFEGNAWAISEGERLFGVYNCTGCHANGGGGIGPPLIKTTWLYGGEPDNIFDTIVKGRPNGMPTWGGKIPEYQIWQLVTWVEAMNKREPRAATPERADTIEQDSGTIPNSPEKFQR